MENVPDGYQVLTGTFKKAVENYAEIMGKSVQDIEIPMPMQTMKDQKDEIIGKANERNKEYLEITLDLLLNLGGFASEAASNAWPPAAICFQALKLLVDSGKHYKKYFSIKGVDDILERISPVLEDIQRYIKGFQDGVTMDSVHLRVVEGRLKLFLDVCAIASKVHQDSGKVLGVVKNCVKTAAGSDGGFEEKLKEMKDLQAREQYILLGDTWNTNQMIGNYFDVKGASGARALKAIEEKMVGSSKDIRWWKSWEDTHRSLKGRHLENTGSWITAEDYKGFQDWADIQKDTPGPVLVLEAPEGGGKSHLCYTIIEKLKQRIENQSVHVAYFYFKRAIGETTSPGHRETGTSLSNALVALAWQLAQSDNTYRTFASGQNGLSSTTQIWDSLMRFSLTKSSKRKVFFLVLDGVNLSTSRSKEELTNKLNRFVDGCAQLRSHHFQIRLLLSGNKETFKGVADHSSGVVRIIDVARGNGDDIRMFVDHEITKMSQSWGSDGELSESLGAVKRSICECSNGNYYKAKSALDEIRQTEGSQSQLQEIQRRGFEDSVSLIKWHVQRLDNMLESEDILLLNCILTQVCLMEKSPKLTTLRYLLKQKFGDGILEGLKDKVSAKFGQLLKVSEDGTAVEFKSEDVKGYFDTRLEENEKLLCELDRLESQTAPTAQVPSYLDEKDLAKLLRDRLIRDPTQRDKKKATIGVNPMIGHLDIIESALQAVSPKIRDESSLLAIICGTRDRCEDFSAYAAVSLGYHLQQIRSKYDRLVPEDAKQRIRDQLKLYFTEESYVKAWLLEASIEGIMAAWPTWTKSLDEVLNWLKQGKYFSRYQFRNISALLNVPTKVLAAQWLREDKWKVSLSFKAFLSFSSKSLLYPNDIRPHWDNIVREFNERSAISSEDIDTTTRVAEKILGEDENGTSRRRVAETLMSYSHYDKAIDQLKGEKEDWKACWCHAQACYQTGRHDDALNSLDSIYPMLQNKEFQKHNGPEWTEMVDTISDWFKKLDRHERAMRFFRNLQKHLEKDVRVSKRALEWVLSTRKTRDLAKFLNIDYTPPVDLFLDCAMDPVFHRSIYISLQEDWRSINDVYERAIGSAASDLAKRACLRYYYGLTLYYQYQLRAASNVWDENITEIGKLFGKPHKDKDVILRIGTKCAERLASRYIQVVKHDGYTQAKRQRYLGYVEGLKLWSDKAFQYNFHSLALLLGRANHLAKKSELAKDCVKEYVTKASELLSDSASANDWEGYWLLCQALIPLNDDDNARAAWSLIADDYFYMNMRCAGQCACTWEEWTKSDIYVCRDCADVQFEESCWARLVDNKLQERVCGGSHGFVVLPRWNAEKAKERLRKRTVEVGTVERSISDWLRDIKKQYGLEVEKRSGRMRSVAKRLMVRA